MSAPRAVEAHDGLPNPQRLLAFTTLAMAISMAVLDGTIVTVALPTMARQFAVAPESAIWIVNAFQLAVTVSLLPLAALGDMLGYRRVYWWGLALFTVASLACALAPTFAVLIFARAVQGLGAAGVMSVNIALIRFIYPHARLGQGVGNMAVVVAVCTAGSPSVAAAILSVASWHWLFLINVPFGARRRRLRTRQGILWPPLERGGDHVGRVDNLCARCISFGADDVAGFCARDGIESSQISSRGQSERGKNLLPGSRNC